VEVKAMPKLYIKTYGCQMNVYDSEKIANILQASHNMELVNDPKDADLILLNTCAIRGKAEQKVFSDLGRFRAFKKKRPEMIIGVGGCVATESGKKILERAPYVSIIFGPQTLHRLPVLYDEASESAKRSIDIRLLKNEKFQHFPPAKSNGPLAYVTIMEGCNRFCSYCIVPFTRGREISRPFQDVLTECEILASQGVKEIHFLGQNVNAYKADDKNLADLIRETAKIPGILRLRFTTSHPADFSERLIEVFADTPTLANHLHLPVQHGSNRILEAMRRNYTVLEYKEKVKKLRQIRPNISVSTDFIVGFPGETEEDFEKMLDLVEEVKFDQSFSFIYSPRPNTKAALLADDMPLAVKKVRLAKLQKALSKHANLISESMLNIPQKVLVVGSSRKNTKELSGRTENNRIVNFLGPADLISQIVEVKITGVLTNSLRGEMCESILFRR